MKKHSKLESNRLEIFAHIFLAVMCVIFVVPLIAAVIVSFSSQESIAKHGYQFIPESFSLEAYEVIFTTYGASLFRSLGITITSGIIAPLLSIFLTMLIAYPLSQADFKGRDFWRIFVLITMLFGGGLIPQYVLRTKYLGLKNNIMVYLIPAIGGWNVFLFRTFFVNIDQAMIESAKIDGANKLQILFRIMLPLTKSLVAINFFTGFLGKWNDITTPLYYITDQALYPIQYLLQRMITSVLEAKALFEEGMVGAEGLINLPVEPMRFAMAVIGALPVFILFPYLQKYYAKGIMLGSTKG